MLDTTVWKQKPHLFKPNSFSYNIQDFYINDSYKKKETFAQKPADIAITIFIMETLRLEV